jgi:opacity protein-like surface antigen
MNKHLLKVPLAAIVSAAAIVPLASNAQVTPFYVHGDIGGNWTLNENVKDFFGPVAPGTKVKFDNGVSTSVAAGYQFTDFAAVEVQPGFIGNRISSITGADVHDARLYNFPLFANLRLQAPDDLFGSRYHLCIVPYIGGGGGFSESVIDAGHITLNGTTVHGTQADTVWAAQAFGGLRWKINSQMSVNVEYRYFISGSPRWSTGFHNSGADSMAFGEAQTHSVVAGFQFNF